MEKGNQCTLCQQNYSQQSIAKVMKCGHTYCSQCAQQNNGSDIYFICPIDNLIDYSSTNYIEKSYNQQLFQEYPNNPVQLHLFDQEICQEHQLKKMIFCKSHKQVICPLCAFETHKPCESEKLDSYICKLQQDLREQLQLLKEKEEVQQRNILELNDQIKLILANDETFRKELSIQQENLIQQIKTKHSQEVEQFLKQAKTEVESVCLSKNGLQQDLQQIQGIKKKETVQDIFQLQKLVEQATNLNSLNIEIGYSSFIQNFEEMLQQFKNRIEKQFTSNKHRESQYVELIQQQQSEIEEWNQKIKLIELQNEEKHKQNMQLKKQNAQLKQANQEQESKIKQFQSQLQSSEIQVNLSNSEDQQQKFKTKQYRRSQNYQNN